MVVLGISDHFTSGATLAVDNRIVAAVNEERLCRKKLVMGFPWKSIEAVLAIAGVRPHEIDQVSVASKWGHFLPKYVDLSRGVLELAEGPVKKTFLATASVLSSLREHLPILEPLYYQLRQPVYIHRRRAIRRIVRQHYGIRAPVKFVWHHFAHAACAYYASGFGDALVVTLDGSGDGHSSHVYEVNDGNWRFLHAVPSFDGVGNYYAYITHLCGFTAGRHEGKITGLAAHGSPIFKSTLEKFVRFTDNTMLNCGNAFRTEALRKLRKALPADARREDLAASIQNLAEEICTNYVDYWQRKTGKTNIALAGGVVANVRINQKIFELSSVESIFVYPAMSDEGLSAGAALSVGVNNSFTPNGGEERCFDNVYLGPDFSDKLIEEALRRAGLNFDRPATIETEIAHLLAGGKVVARVAGRMEYGPRALGNRSILYRPDDLSANDWLNQRLNRTEFMPFAPSTLAEDAGSSYENIEGAEDAGRFMTVTFNCSNEMKRTCPGVVHVDGTARPQLVNRTDNPSYYEIIREFKKITGVPSIVNTSFNIHEEPIVCTPDDAIRAFQAGHLDILAIGPFIARTTSRSTPPRDTRQPERLSSASD